MVFLKKFLEKKALNFYISKIFGHIQPVISSKKHVSKKDPKVMKNCNGIIDFSPAQILAISNHD